MLTGSSQYSPGYSGAELVRGRRSLFWRLLRRHRGPGWEREIIEQRIRARHPVQAPATMTELNGRGMPGRSWQVEVIDLSKGGAAFATAVFIAPGTPVIVQFSAGEEGAGRSIMATTRHIRRLNELEFAVGVRFETSRGREPGTYHIEVIDAA